MVVVDDYTNPGDTAIMSALEQQAADNVYKQAGAVLSFCRCCGEYVPVCPLCGAYACGQGCDHLSAFVADWWTMLYDREIARLRLSTSQDDS